MATKKANAKKDTSFAAAMMRAMTQDNAGNVRAGKARKSGAAKKKK